MENRMIMKKIGEKLKEAWYGALPILLLVGVPLTIAVAAFLIGYWNDIPKILSHIADMGNGSLLYGAFLILFGVVGLTNIAVSVWITAHKIDDYLTRNQKKSTPLIIFLVVTVLGVYAAAELLRKF